MWRAALSSLLLCACGPELNPARTPPAHAELVDGGVWVAYNLGCELGCDQVRRGDRIVTVDGRPVGSGAEVDALGLARGAPVVLRVVPHGTAEFRDVTIVAAPRDDLPPIVRAPPLFTVGASALDRAPEWARDKLFGHAIPALRFYRADEPRGYINGRELHGRGALLVIWEMPTMMEARLRSRQLLPGVYADLQDHADELQEVGVDPYFITDFRADDKIRALARRRAREGESGLIPIFQLASTPRDPNTLGIEGGAADIRESLRDYVVAPIVLVIDRRGIVRFHARGLPLGAHETMAAAIDFALEDLPDEPFAPTRGA